MKIGMIGAGGMLGFPVCRRLLEDGHAVKAMARDAAALRARMPALDVVRGDAMIAADVRSAFEGCDVLYVSVSPGRDQKRSAGNAEVEALGSALAMAQNGEIGRVAYLGSIMQAHTSYRWWVLDDKRKLARRLRESGVKYSHFLPSSFMENLPFRYLRGDKVTLIGPSRARWWWVAARDYAEVVAAALREPREDREEIYVQGPERLTAREAAETFVANVDDRKLGVADAPKPLLKLVALFQPELRYAIRITEAGEKLDEPFLAGHTWERYGKPGITVEKFAAGRLWR